MDQFQNKLIVREEVYENGFFPKVPKAGKRGTVLILSGGCNDDIVVNERTTSKQIRQGKYTQLVEISTVPYLKEIRFHSPSRETHYFFDVYVKAVIQVNDPLIFYVNRNIDVDAYFENLFSLDVRKITRGYSILDFEGMDEDLTEKLSSYNTVDESTGFKYQISAVDAIPGENAREYVQKYGKQILDAEIKMKARHLADVYKCSFEDAVRTEVAEGKLTEIEAIIKIQEYNNLNFQEQVRRLEEMREKDLLTDSEVRKFAIPVFADLGRLQSIEVTEQETPQEPEVDEFYTEDEEK